MYYIIYIVYIYCYLIVHKLLRTTRMTEFNTNNVNNQYYIRKL